MIDIYYFGKIKNREIEKVISYYLKISQPNIVVNRIELKEYKSANEEEKKKREFLLMENKMTDDRNYKILLDVNGKELSTEKFAEKMKLILNESRHISFYIGNYYGLNDVVRKKADMLLSLSKLTFNHELALLLLSEQIFRVKNILFGGKYNK